MEPYERMKELRKNILNLNQEEFGIQLGISRGNVANIEVGRISLTSRNTSTICEKFGVNEVWLREGIEPIFKQRSEQESIAGFMGDVMASKDNDFQKRFILALSQLDDDGWDVLEKLIDNISKVK